MRKIPHLKIIFKTKIAGQAFIFPKKAFYIEGLLFGIWLFGYM